MRVDQDEAGLRAENARLRDALRDAERRLEALARLGRADHAIDGFREPEPLPATKRLGLDDLRQRQEFVEGILRSSGDCIDVLDLDARLVFMSEGGARIMEIDDLAPLIGFAWIDFWEGDSRAAAEAALAVARAGGAGRFLGAAPTAKGAPKWWDVVVTPMRDAGGGVAHLLSVSRDVTRAKAAENALRESEERLRLAQAAAGIGVFDLDLGTGEVLMSDEARAIFGLAADRAYSDAELESLALPEDRGLVSRGDERRAGIAVRNAEFRIRRPDDGRVVHIARHADYQLGPDGRPMKFLGVVQDVTDRKEAQAQQRLLMQELAHRVKNTLAIIKAIANQTLKTLEDRDEVRAFDARLLAVSRAFDVLLQESWTAARILLVVEGAVGAHGGRRFALEGPDLMIGPKAALSLVLLLHELSTNAVKYGALSDRAGRVDVLWRVDRSGEEPELIVEWVESGGPEIRPPTRTGFGSRIVKLGLAGSKQAELDFRSAGLRALFRAPLSSMET